LNKIPEPRTGPSIEKTVPPETPRQRLDRYLADSGLSFTRSRIQTLIRSGAVRVNDDVVLKTGWTIEPGDRITAFAPNETPTEMQPEDIPLDIRFEDEFLLVVNKPPGMVVHPACGHRSATLVNALLYHSDRLSHANEAARPGIVHRLDMDTSGLLVVAKRDDIHAALSAQLAERVMTRRYDAVVWGIPRFPEGRIEAPIGRHPTHRQRMAVVDTGHRKHAITYYRVMETFVCCTLLSLKLETGRTHQIRVHLAHIGHPVFGDPVYEGRTRAINRLSPVLRRQMETVLDSLPRQALHASTLAFVHPATGERIEVHAPPPDDMMQTIRRLREN